MKKINMNSSDVKVYVFLIFKYNAKSVWDHIYLNVSLMINIFSARNVVSTIIL